MELKPWMVAGMVVCTVGIGGVSLHYGNPQALEKASAQPLEEDFEVRIAAANGQGGTVTQASAATVPGLAPAPGQPVAAQRLDAATAGRAGAATRAGVTTTTTGPAGNSGSAPVVNNNQPAPASQNDAAASSIAVSTSANAPAAAAQTQVNNQPQTGIAVQPPAQLSTDDLWTEAARLKGATGSTEVKRRLEVNRELFNRLWAIRRSAEQQSRDAKERSSYDAAQAQVQSTTRQINDVEAAIAADSAQVAGT